MGEPAGLAYMTLAKAKEEDELKENVEAAAKAAGKSAIPPRSSFASDGKKMPIKFKDAVGRKFNFPFHLCNTWMGMEDLIRQAFLHVEVIGPHVVEGHYDLVGPQGDIILPQVWETVIEPGWTITMHMWPMPEPPPVEEPPAEFDREELPSSDAHFGGHPMRHPRGRGGLQEFFAKPTSKFGRSKNVVTSQHQTTRIETKKPFSKMKPNQVSSKPKPNLATIQAWNKKERSHEDLNDQCILDDNAPPPYADIVSPEGTRHSGNPDCVLRTRFVCVDISHDKHVLSNCEDCTKGKKYYSFYKAALHLRQDHLKNQAQGLKDSQLSTEVLKQWITEIEELVPEHLAPYDDFNYLEDNPHGWGLGVDAKSKTPESLSGEFWSDGRDTKPDTHDSKGESIDADYKGSYPCDTEAITPDVTRRKIPILWFLIFHFIWNLMLSLYLLEYLLGLFPFAFEPYQTLVGTVGLHILSIVLLALVHGFSLLVFSLEISVPRNDQITGWEWESGMYHFKLFFYNLRTRIYREDMPMMGRCRIESCSPDQLRHSPPNIFTEVATMYERASLVTWAQVRIVRAWLTRGRPTSTRTTRIHSQCRCGHRFFDDYFELKDGAASRYSRLLQRRSPIASPERSSGRQVSSWESSLNSGTSNLISSAMILIDGLGAFGNRVVGRDNVETSLPQYRLENTSNERPGSQGRNDELLFLLLCVPHRQYATKLLQPQVSAVRSDKDFFRLLRTNYQQMRGRVKRALSLKTLRSIKFVQLEMYKSELVDIRKQDDMPPEAKKDEYRYNPIPAEIIPPVGENHMLHLINHPSHAEEDGLLLDRIPKKLKERLLVCPSRGTGLGWGIYFIEGWHISVITLVAFAVVLAGSLAFLVCWSVLKHDVQGASGVAAYMIAFLGLAIGSVQAVFELT